MRSESRRGAGLVVVFAAMLPLCFACWLLWRSFSGGQDPAGGAFPVSAPPAKPSERLSGGPVPSASRDSADAPADGGERKREGRGHQRGHDNGTADSEASEGRDGGGGARQASRPLAGKVVVLDPGHNVNNHRHIAVINKRVDAGTFHKECDTTGTSTVDGYAEASFTMNLAERTRKILRERGAKVRFTHEGDREWGPCVDERADIGNRAGADAAVSIHADGSAPGNRGFHIIVPGAVRQGEADTTEITGPSRTLGEQLRRHFASATSMPRANYLGGGTGITTREDLGGLNLSRVPKVFIECGNMRDPVEADKLRDPVWRQHAAEGIADGISGFLTRGS